MSPKAKTPIIVLTNFMQQLPELKMDQESSLDFIGAAHMREPNSEGVSLTKLLKRYGVKASQIANRYFEDLEIAADGKDMLSRATFFARRAREVVSKLYVSDKTAPDQLIHVTCTGYVSPSPAQHLVNDRAWAGKTGITHAYHMGCYASLPAVRIAEGFVAAKNKRVDIVHTEMCGLHMDRTEHSPEQLVVQSLFADGHIRYSAVSADSLELGKNTNSNSSRGFLVHAIDEWLVPNSQQDMSWITASWGMKMTLSREVPEKISGSLRGFVINLCERAQVDFSEVMKTGIFAVHPGGPKIIDAVQECLELRNEQIQASREVLSERGNMSSATLPHVWHKLLLQNIPPGKKVLSLAFGPGLTIFGALFESL